MAAAGGDEIRLIDNQDGTAEVIHLFKTTGSGAALSIPDSHWILEGSLRFLLVGGGGSGGSDCGGGGGAGGLVYFENLDPAPGDYAVTVGAGAPARPYSETPRTGTNGADSEFVYGSQTYVATGGGGGGSYNAQAGSSGGSGGGGSKTSNGGSSTQLSYDGHGFGNVGGTSSETKNNGSGGGGAGGAGEPLTSNAGGAGGAGLMFDISGEEAWYAGGGGGGGVLGNAVGAGGSGIGGDGGNYPNSTVDANLNSGKSGAANTGSGGGGGCGGGGSAERVGGAGGSGVLIVRYTIKFTTSDGEGATRTEVNGQTVWTFTDASAPGKLILSGAVEARILVVGGGGAGGCPNNSSTTVGGAGGGGGGGVFETNSILLQAGEYEICVGAGGEAGLASVLAVGNNGAPSYIALNGTDIMRAEGGGGGGVNSKDAGSGGSGGGASKNKTGGSGIDGQGYKGGDGKHNRAGAGGGGAGGPGGDTTGIDVGGAGGAGRVSDISGKNVAYGGGGGGGTRTGTKAAAGGEGGGGDGGYGAAGAKVRPGGGTNGLGGGGGGGTNSEAGGAGGSGVVIVRIVKVMPEKPSLTSSSLTYNGLEQIPFDYTPGAGYSLTGAYAATDVGAYTFTASLDAGCVWSDGTSDSLTYDWQITPATLQVKSFTLENWQEGARPATPELVVGTAEGLVVAVPAENIRYRVRLQGNSAWTDVGTIDGWPAAMAAYGPGKYELTAAIASAGNYQAPATIPVVAFMILATEASPVSGLGYVCKFTVTADPGETLADFPMLVRLRENSPVGFHYRTVQPDRSDLRFTDETGANLPYEIEVWNDEGESLIWVRASQYRQGAAIRMCWGRLVDENGADIEIDAEHPLLPASDVWSGYLGVWHMDEEIAAVQAPSTVSKDSTANANDGVPQGPSNAVKQQMVSTAGVLGNARVNSTGSASAQGHNRLSTAVYGGLDGVFTYSGWYRLTATTVNYPRLAGTKSGTSGNGWSIELNNSATGINVRHQGSALSAVSGLPDCRSDWVYYVFVYNGTEMRTYANGELKNTATITKVEDSDYALAIGADATGAEFSWFGAYDEIRYGQGAWSTARVAADYAQFQAAQYGCDGVTVVPGSKFKNFWFREPSTPVDSWGTGEEPELDRGQSAYGDAYFAIVAVDGTMFVETYPPRAGDYQVIFRADAGADELKSWTEVATAPVPVSVTAHSPYGGLAGTAGTATLSGRTLLANNDAAAQYPIVDQNYSFTDPAAGVYWLHGDETPNSRFPNLKKGLEHRLIASSPVDELCGATNIWRLTQVYLGTTYTASGQPNSQRNYLPCPESAGGIAKGVHLVMNNVVGAEIASPCYTNGIGTIYFDAVNMESSADGAFYRLAVEYALGTTTNEAELVWETATILPLKRSLDVGEEFQKLSETNELALAIDQTGTDANFYRAVVELDIDEPVRFRIRRASAPDSASVSPGEGAFILVDNLIVSYPAMRADMYAYGRYDAAKTGKSVLGQELAWRVPYPAVDQEILVRGRPVYRSNPATNAQPVVDAARLHYRWRYLNQAFDPADGSWRVVNLDTSTFEAAAPLELPAGLPGDIEFWFDLTANAPYYKYYDYSGLGLRLSGHYGEEQANVTNRAAATGYPTGGSDWFVRLRQGRSVYASMLLQVEMAGATNSIPMELTPDDVWRGFLPLRAGAGLPATVAYRVVGCDRQTAGATEYEQNRTYWVQGEAAEKLPVNTTLVAAGEEDAWGTLPVDDQTGYLLVQFDENTRATTIVRADYQDFNAWSDANRPDRAFVGSSTEDDKKSGTSAAKREYVADFDCYLPMPASDEAWIVPSVQFTDTGNLYGRAPWSVFASDVSGAWTVGKGMWISRMYREDRANTGVALQMEGNGNGFVQLTDSTYAPRGIEKISFNARIGQAVSWDDFAWYFGDNPASLKNYTLVVNCAFDEAGNTSFRGNASLSLCGYYRPGIGAYEFRFEQYRKADNSESLNPKSQILSLYRWRSSRPTLLCAWTNTDVSVVNTTASNRKYLPLFISVSNESANATCILAGVFRGNSGAGVETTGSYHGSYRLLGYRDTSSARIQSGTFGMTTANCPGVFNRPIYYAAAVPFQGGNDSQSNTRLDWSDKTITFTGSNTIDLGDTITGNREDEDFLWSVPDGRLEPYKGDGQYWGLRASIPKQTLTLKTAPAGKTNWTTVKVFDIEGFGTAGAVANYAADLFSVDDVSVRLEIGGSVDDVRTDVVLDSLTMNQWRGLDWNRSSAYVRPQWDTSGSLFGMTNFVFSSAWTTNIVTAGANATTNGMMLLSAKRAKPGTVSGIRSPLMDGKDGRGSGLGMISFSYRNAQPNAVLTLQIATNDVRSSQLENMDVPYGGFWTDVTNFTFTGLSQSELASGVRSCYLGIHGVPGLMRLMVATNAIAAVSSTTDRTRFGEILIDKIFCRDEPALDGRSWWGWNLRTLGDYSDAEKRMYLPDCTLEPEAVGMSLVLNNSTVADTIPESAAEYPQNKPFVQTPNFAQDLDGEISFLARKYRYTAADTNLSSAALAALNDQPAALVLFASRSGAPDGEWVRLGEPFIVSNHTFTAFKYTPDPGTGYRAFRLAVSGVPGVRSSGPVYPEDGGYDAPVRVLLDEVVVNEAVRARMAFRNVGAIRGYGKLGHSLNDLKAIVPCPDVREQPLCKEAWGVQCEVYPAQLGDTIDTAREPIVYLHWFRGAVPWGYDSWKARAVDGAQRGRVRLSRAEDADGIYRSSYQDNADSTVPMSQAAEVVQYMLEVQFFTKGASVASTNLLTSSDWRKPEWYRGVDFNAQYGTNVQFAAYNLLDPVAPGWAWINEVNLFGSYDRNWSNSDAQLQFVEIAAPADADLTDWQLRMYEAVSDTQVVTNNVARFGGANYGVVLAGTKPDNLGMEDGMVFRVVGNKGYYSAERKALGEVDGIWRFDYESSTFNTSGEIFAINPIGIQLVRGNGVVEHEIVVVGTNYWETSENFRDQYSPTNSANRLNRMLAASEARFFYAGADDRGGSASLGVASSQGETAAVWTNAWTMTPGRRNAYQTIDADSIPTPNGESITIYCNLDHASGPIRQTVGSAVDTNASQIIYLRRGSQYGTNIVYTVGRWYELGSVLTNRAPALATSAGRRRYVVNVGKGASNSISVVAAAAPLAKLREDYGLTADNRYADAIMDWLRQGQTLRGPMAHPDDDEIRLAEFHSLGGSIVTNMDLTTMYWLDMDPTVGNLRLVGGMSSIGDTRPVCEGQTNELMTVKLYITNATDDAGSPYYNQPAWSPYVLRGMLPGENSQDSDPGRWTNVTFKITGRLLNGQTTSDTRYRVPLRYFVFRDGSFDAGHEAKIEIVDPYSKASPSCYYSGWYDWAQKYGRTVIGYFWSIDGRLQPEEISVLRPENYYVYPTVAP